MRLVRSGISSSGWVCSDILILLHVFMRHFLMIFPSTLPSSPCLVHLSGQNFPAESFIHPFRFHLSPSHRSALNRTQREQSCLLRFGQSPDLGDSKSLVGSVTPQCPHLLPAI